MLDYVIGGHHAIFSNSLQSAITWQTQPYEVGLTLAPLNIGF
jgi:hypothetical protein